jgi:5'-3' exonuclease
MKLNGTGLHFFYSQLITGDVVDNYKGLDNVGCTVAYELLKDSKDEQELFDKVADLYKEKIGDEWFTYLLEQGQLAHMQTYRDELWHPRERGIRYEARI